MQSQPAGDVLHLRRGVPMPPTPLDGKPLPLDSAIDRRAYFADWLTAPDNPYFAKALVNRVWRNFLGRGLVEAEDDLRQTNPPTNPELFDALAKDFVDAQVRCQAPDPHHHELGGVSAFVAAAAGQRERRSLLLALPDPPAVGRGDPRRLLAGDGRADAVHAGQLGGRRRGDASTTAIRSARGPCNCPTRWWSRGSSTPSAGRSARRPARANGSRTPASARRCTSTTARRSTTSCGRRTRASRRGCSEKITKRRRYGDCSCWPCAASRRRRAEEVSGPVGRSRRRREDDTPRGAGRSVLGRAGIEGIHVQPMKRDTINKPRIVLAIVSGREYKPMLRMPIPFGEENKRLGIDGTP